MIVSHGVNYVKEGISETLLDRVRNDSNCARSLMGNKFDDVVTPQTEWHTLLWGTIEVGAVMKDAPIANGFQCHHIHLLKEYKDKERAAILTQLSAIASLVRGVRPFTICSSDKSYDYMRNFLRNCGFKMEALAVEVQFDTFIVPYDWQPTFHDAKIMF